MPGFQRYPGQPVQKQRIDLFVGGDVRGGGNGCGFDVFAVRGQLAFQQGAEAVAHVQILAHITLLGINRAGMGVDGIEDHLGRIQAKTVAGKLFPNIFAKIHGNRCQVGADQHQLLGASLHSHGGGGEVFFI